MEFFHLSPSFIFARLIILVTLAVLSISPARAVTYYVNAATGNDTWSGTKADPIPSPATDGPWRTLAKVNATVLKPGDSVLLSCGQTWNESLIIANSGTVANPIKIGPYPATCFPPPSISGIENIPSYAWSLYKNNIYMVQFPLNLVLNSSFNTSLGGWYKYSPTNDTLMVLNPCNGPAVDQCMAVTTGASYGLVISNNFPLHATSKYSVTLSFKAPAGLVVPVIVRRGAAPWESVGLSSWITGTGNWQTLNFPFVASKTIDNARVDIQVPAGQQNVLFNDVAIRQNLDSMAQVFADGAALNPAHHPNAGFNTNRPRSVYLSMAADGDRVLQPDGRYVSTFIETGSDLVLPSGGALSNELSARVRTSPWSIDERTIAAVAGSRIALDKPMRYQAKAGFGYFLLGALWMLDSPGEWFYDSVSKTLYVRMPDNAPPGSRVTIGKGEGVNLDGKSNINISGIWIQGTGRGVSMTRSKSIVLSNLLIEKTQAQGIDAQAAIDATIADNTIRATGREAIYAEGPLGIGSNMTITGNAISQSGVLIANGVPISLPAQTVSAIGAGKAAKVAHNTIMYSSYIGIRPGPDSMVSDNWIDHSCMVLDDCGAIYTSGPNYASQIERNLVTNLPGNPDGKATHDTHTVGVYLDNFASNVNVTNNSLTGADFGLQVHNGAYNTLSGNTFYGNRLYQLFMQEDTTLLNARGDLHDNTVMGNIFQPTLTLPSIYHLSTVGDASRFAVYDRNMYSTLLFPTIAKETIIAGPTYYTFPMWQLATIHGAPRNLDPSGSAVTVRGFATYAIAGSNLVANGDFTRGYADWYPYQGQAFLSTSCPKSPCLQFTASLNFSRGLIPSPNFSVLSGRYYRVSFDFKTRTDNQRLSSVVRRGGGGNNGYESLPGTFTQLVGSTSWKRQSYIFQASKTINKNDPVTLDNGARLDFQDVLTGQTIFIDNVEVVPVTPVGIPLKTNALVNNTNSVAELACPDEVSAPDYCGQYVRFLDSTPINWPHDVQPLSAEVIYTLDRTSLDSDNDGIPNAQDLCPNTAPTLSTNSKGCAINQ